MFRQTSETGAESAAHSELIGAVAALIKDHFDGNSGPVARLDRWTRQCITVENQAKLSRILNSRDPAEACLAALIREIDREARFGVYLPTPAGNAAQLNRLSGESRMSGRLFQYVDVVAPVMFQPELALNPEQPELVWSTVEARYERAGLDAEVSEFILLSLRNDEEEVADLVDSLRARFYAYHEDRVRRRCRLPLLLDPGGTRSLHSTIAELRERAVLESAGPDGTEPAHLPCKAC